MTSELPVHKLGVGLIAAALNAMALQPSAVSRNEAAVWIRQCVPLPRAITLAQKVVLEPAAVSMQVKLPAAPAADRAVQELRETLRLTGAQPAQPACFSANSLRLVIPGPRTQAWPRRNSAKARKSPKNAVDTHSRTHKITVHELDAKQFSLKRAASRKQFPISSTTRPQDATSL